MKKIVYSIVFVGVLAGAYYLTLSFLDTPTVVPSAVSLSAAGASTTAAAPVEIMGGGDAGSSTASTSTSQRIRIAKFKGSVYEPYAVQIAPGPLSTAATQALTAFTMRTVPQGNGAMEVTLTARTNRYQNQQYELEDGDTLYFIEPTSVTGGESPSGAPGGGNAAIVVDRDGYIVE